MSATDREVRTELAGLLAGLHADDVRKILAIVRRIKGGAVQRVEAIKAARKGEIEIETAEDALDARIYSVLALLERGEIRGRRLPPGVL